MHSKVGYRELYTTVESDDPETGRTRRQGRLLEDTAADLKKELLPYDQQDARWEITQGLPRSTASRKSDMFTINRTAHHRDATLNRSYNMEDARISRSDNATDPDCTKIEFQGFTDMTNCNDHTHRESRLGTQDHTQCIRPTMSFHESIYGRERHFRRKRATWRLAGTASGSPSATATFEVCRKYGRRVTGRSSDDDNDESGPCVLGEVFLSTGSGNQTKSAVKLVQSMDDGRYGWDVNSQTMKGKSEDEKLLVLAASQHLLDGWDPKGCEGLSYDIRKTRLNTTEQFLATLGEPCSAKSREDMRYQRQSTKGSRALNPWRRDYA